MNYLKHAKKNLINISNPSFLFNTGWPDSSNSTAPPLPYFRNNSVSSLNKLATSLLLVFFNDVTLSYPSSFFLIWYSAKYPKCKFPKFFKPFFFICISYFFFYNSPLQKTKSKKSLSLHFIEINQIISILFIPI